MMMGEFDQARSSYLAALRLDPNQPGVEEEVHIHRLRALHGAWSTEHGAQGTSPEHGAHGACAARSTRCTQHGARGARSAQSTRSMEQGARSTRCTELGVDCAEHWL